MALAKQQFVAGVKITRLNLDEKIKILNDSNKNPKKSCRETSTHFQTSV